MTFTSRLRRQWPWLLGLLLLAVVSAVAAGIVARRYVATELRARAIAVLEERLESQVELADLDVSVGAVIALRGTGLVIRHHRRTDVPPLVRVGEFRARAAWFDLVATPRRLRSVELRDLSITVPNDGSGVREKERGGCRGEPREVPPATRPAEVSPFVVNRLESRQAEVVLLPSRPGKPPRVFQVHDLLMHDFALDRAARFDAQVSNPVPRGEISTRGEFGPWNAHVPGATPLKGAYEFTRADLGTIKGLEGVLDSNGAFEGELRQISVRGETRTPGFGLSTSRNRMPLTTRFEACVDGTDGDTYLERVDATLNDTRIEASGRIEGRVGVGGRRIDLEIARIDGRIEDLVRLAVDDASPLAGDITSSATLRIDPGPDTVIRRMRSEGTFALDDLKITRSALQARINELSRRGRGDMEAASAAAVRSRVAGRFSIDGGVIRIPAVRFLVPGAAIQLGGSYGLESERVDFRGRVRLAARASEMVDGWKSWMVKPLDPLLARDGAGVIVPLSITGTRDAPQVDIDVSGTLFGEKSARSSRR